LAGRENDQTGDGYGNDGSYEDFVHGENDHSDRANIRQMEFAGTIPEVLADLRAWNGRFRRLGIAFCRRFSNPTNWLPTRLPVKIRFWLWATTLPNPSIRIAPWISPPVQRGFDHVQQILRIFRGQFGRPPQMLTGLCTVANAVGQPGAWR